MKSYTYRINLIETESSKRRGPNITWTVYVNGELLGKGFATEAEAIQAAHEFINDQTPL